MTDEISVIVFKPKGREFYQAQWSDPTTGLKKTRSTKKKIRRDAERVAAVLQKELNEGKYKHPSKVTWEEFRDRYEAEVLPGLAVKTRGKVDSVFNSIETHINPKHLASIDAEQISKYQTALRNTNRSENTIKSHLSHIKAALRWAKDQRMLVEVPAFKMPSRTNTARRRAVTGEEFERIIEAVPKIVGEEQSENWRYFIRGLWWSGLRLGEALALTWDDPSTLCLILDGRRPLLSIPPDKQKNHETTLLPIAPEFFDHLQTIPKSKRTGKVFYLWSTRYKVHRPTTYYTVGKIVGEICKTAKVKTSDKEYASAHDFRRSFGVRWSKRVMPPVLQKLMRHASIQTTMKFYAVEEASETADAVWESFANTLANTDKKSDQNREQESSTSKRPQRV